MKKGCFIKSVVIGTIFIAAFIYLVQNKFNEWFLKPGKELILNEIVNKWDTDLRYIYDSAEKDSLKNLLTYYIDNVKSLDEIVNLEEQSFLKEFDRVIEDSLISKDEISKITSFVKEELYEKSKSN